MLPSGTGGPGQPSIVPEAFTGPFEPHRSTPSIPKRMQSFCPSPVHGVGPVRIQTPAGPRPGAVAHVERPAP
eukprot:12712472-Alexandrium_andersonii.AAC.1